jgi:hypothetical protein
MASSNCGYIMVYVVTLWLKIWKLWSLHMYLNEFVVYGGNGHTQLDTEFKKTLNCTYVLEPIRRIFKNNKDGVIEFYSVWSNCEFVKFNVCLNNNGITVGIWRRASWAVAYWKLRLVRVYNGFYFTGFSRMTVREVIFSSW